MSQTATERTGQEYLFMPAGMFKGIPFPDIPQKYLRDVLNSKNNTEPEDEKYPGLFDSISDFLNGKGYYFGEDTPEKAKARAESSGKSTEWAEYWGESEKTQPEPPKGNPWQGAKTQSAHNPPEPKASPNADWFNQFFREAYTQGFEAENARSRQQRHTQDFEEAKRQRWEQEQQSERERRQPPPRSTTGSVNKEMAKEIIAAGRRAMAAKHHPDKGGSEEAMKAYNAAADWLEKLI